MHDLEVMTEFLDDGLAELEIGIPEDIDKNKLAGTFCTYVDNDYHEWLKDNFKSFFEHGDPDWDRIREAVAKSRDSS